MFSLMLTFVHRNKGLLTCVLAIRFVVIFLQIADFFSTHTVRLARVRSAHVVLAYG